MDTFVVVVVHVCNLHIAFLMEVLHYGAHGRVHMYFFLMCVAFISVFTK